MPTTSTHEPVMLDLALCCAGARWDLIGTPPAIGRRRRSAVK